MSIEDLNSEFFNRAKIKLGVEAFEEFENSVLAEKLKNMKDDNVNLLLLGTSVNLLKNNVESIKEIFSDTYSMKKSVIYCQLLRETLLILNEKALHEVDIIFRIISDAVIDQVEEGEEEDEFHKEI